MNQTTQAATHKRWDDPSFWERISVGYCQAPTHPVEVERGHVLQNGICWNCRQVAK